MAATKSKKSTTKAKTNIALLQRASGCTREEVLALTGSKAVSMQQVAASPGGKLKIEKVEGKPIRYRAQNSK